MGRSHRRPALRDRGRVAPEARRRHARHGRRPGARATQRAARLSAGRSPSMAAEALLHDLTDSPFCAKARICLAVKGVSFRRLTLTVRGLRRLRTLNQLGPVPVLDHAGRVIADPTAIAHYLEERFPEPSLLPPDPAARAYCTLVEDWADESLSFVVGAFRWLNPANRAVALRSTVRELGGGPPRAGSR